MHYYIMKALTHDKCWFEFTMHDLPTMFSATEFVLLGRPNTPRLYINSIRRGDVESNLYEGDIIKMDGTQWLICYERGFYAINASYVVRNLYTLKDYELLGTCSDMKSPVPINFRTKYLFMYGDTIFRLHDIVGAYDGKLLLRCISNPVAVDDIRQECCVAYAGNRVYLGDCIEGGIVELHGGRITLNRNNEITDLITGGSLDGYIPKPIR